MQSGLISVVIVNWNRQEMLTRCLRSLAGQTVKTFEIVLVDNGSSDDSVKMVTRDFPNVRVIRNARNLGFCAANNQGIRESSGEFIALLNNDAEAEPGFLAALRAVFEQRPHVGMAAAKILIYQDPRRIDKAGHLIFPDGQNRGRGSGSLDEGQFDRMEPVLWADGCAAMYRREMLDKIGAFDEDFFAYADDAELGLRARIAGWECIYTPHAIARHHRGSTLGVRSVRRLMLIERNRVLLAAKLFPWSLLLLNPWYYAQRLAAGVQASFAGEGEAALFPGWRGKWDLVRGLLWGDCAALLLLPRMLWKRRQIARIRKLTPGQVRQLILDNRITLRELSTQAAVH